MEHVMNVPRQWEAEFVCDWGKDSSDSEWAFLFGHKLGVRQGASKVSSFEPNFVTLFERGEGVPVPGFHGLVGEFMGC